MCSRSVSEGETASVLLRFFYGRYFSPTLKLKWSEQVISKEYVRLRDVRSRLWQLILAFSS